MSEQNRHHEELEALLAGVVEGELSVEQTKRLEALLHDDPTQREFYVRFMITHALLRWSHAGVGSNAKKETAAAGQTSALPASALPITDQPILDAGTIPTIPGAAPTSSGTGGLGGSLFSYPVIFGFLLLLAATSAVVLPRFFTGRPAAPGNPTDVAVQPEISVNPAVVKAEIAAVAKMTAGENCQWGDLTPGLRIGDGISIGQSLNLVSGVAEFTFDIGARVIVQSPASFSVDSSKSIRMQSGKLTAEITKAQAQWLRSANTGSHFRRSRDRIWRRSCARRQQPRSRVQRRSRFGAQQQVGHRVADPSSAGQLRRTLGGRCFARDVGGRYRRVICAFDGSSRARSAHRGLLAI